MIEEIFQVAILALIQGVTEFLPISSSGHLALADRLLGMKGDAVLVSAVLHAGTLVAVALVYWRELLSLFGPDRHRLLLQVLVATAMVGVVGLTLEFSHADKLLFERTLLVPAAGFFVTAGLLRFRLGHQAQQVSLARIPWSAALCIGLMQMVAILPGISRSGATITAGLRCRLKRDDAAAFSFLLMVPAVAGACGVKVLTACFCAPEAQAVPWLALAIGFVIAGVIGFAAINTLLNAVRRGNFRVYSWYCLALGVVSIVVEFWYLLAPAAK